ncbi:hypothetical protein CPT_Minot_040 [Acinetobacter phage Minot]|nr:hypothetical protein CPT_Minot_040 [Acinetobacter phage Minot]QQO96492.1 hypothetical protein CPT_Mokit_041 [Acinetobacter phage Mokit]
MRKLQCKYFLSHFDASQFVLNGNHLVNEANGISILVMPEDNSFALYQNNEFVKVENESGLEELVNQVIKSFIKTRHSFESI